MAGQAAEVAARVAMAAAALEAARGGQARPRLAAQLDGRVGTGQLNVLLLAVPPHVEAKLR